MPPPEVLCFLVVCTTFCPSVCPRLRVQFLETGKDILPLGYNYHLCHLHDTSSVSSNIDEAFEATLRLQLKSEEEVQSWLEAFNQSSFITWRVMNTYIRSGKVVAFKKKYRCQHNTRPRGVNTNKKRKNPTKNTDCRARFTVTVQQTVTARKSRRKYDKHLPNFPTKISMLYQHNHKIMSADALKFRDVSKETSEKLIELFYQNHKPKAALEILKRNLQAEYGSEYCRVASDRSLCPDVMYCYRLYYKTFKNKVKDRHTKKGKDRRPKKGPKQIIVKQERVEDCHADTSDFHSETDSFHPDTNCLQEDTNCLHGDTNHLHGDTNHLHADTNCLHTDTNYLHADTNCFDADTNCHHADTCRPLQEDTNHLHADTNCFDADTYSLLADTNCHHANTNSRHPDTNSLDTDTGSLHTQAEVKNMPPQGNLPQVAQDAALKQEFRNMFEDIIQKLDLYPDVFRPAIQSMLSNYKRYIPTYGHLVAAMQTFGVDADSNLQKGGIKNTVQKHKMKKHKAKKRKSSDGESRLES
ncbi:uncharacterized protein [Amphiura filiformis]|uniref:uncharacterized protein n=1 Tax=Amphiura filiformis TaxID=82378 RepID=UPI003B21ED9B